MELVHTMSHPGGEGPRPTLFALHGHGAHAQDLLGLAPYMAGGRVLVICPEAEFVLQPGMLSFTWFNREADGSRSPEEFERVATMLERFVDWASDRYPVDREHTAVMGFSHGGTLAYRLGLARPERYRGVAALSTWLPEEALTHAGDAEALKRLPVLVQHGSQDPLVRVDRGRSSRERLREAGIEAEYHEYGMEHAISPESLSDLSRWLERVLELPPVAGGAFGAQ